jgi:hypothetical protein
LLEARRQFPHFRQNVEAATASAKAAQESADAAKDAFLSTHRPQIRVRHVWILGNLWGDAQVFIRAQIVNVGVTTAKIIEYSAKTLVLPARKPLPPIPQYGYRVMVRAAPFLKSGHSTDLPADADLPALQEHIRTISHEDNSDIRNGIKQLYCFGYVKYEDAAGRPITTAFCRVLEPPTGIGSFSENGRLVKLKPENTDYEYQD